MVPPSPEKKSPPPRGAARFPACGGGGAPGGGGGAPRPVGDPDRLDRVDEREVRALRAREHGRERRDRGEDEERRHRPEEHAHERRRRDALGQLVVGELVVAGGKQHGPHSPASRKTSTPGTVSWKNDPSMARLSSAIAAATARRAFTSPQARRRPSAMCWRTAPPKRRAPSLASAQARRIRKRRSRRPAT